MNKDQFLTLYLLDENDRRLNSVTFSFNPESANSFLPLEFISSADIPVDKVTVETSDAKKEMLHVFLKNMDCSTRDIPKVIIRDFAFVGSESAILGSDFLSLFTYRISDNKLYLIGLR